MSDFAGFRRPSLRPGVRSGPTADGGVEFTYLDGRRFVEFEFDADRAERFLDFVGKLAEGGLSAAELGETFPGSPREYGEMLAALDEQGMIAEAEAPAAGGMSGIGAYAYLRRHADRVRAEVHSPLVQALADGTATREQLIGYAVEYWHVTHLCPRALAPVLARDDLGPPVWEELMRFYMTERNHDRMMERSLLAAGVPRERLLRAQPLPATMAIMASLGVYAYNFPLALISTLFPMEEPEPEFLELFRLRCAELDLPDGFVGPIAGHSDVNEDEAHEAVTLDLLARLPYLSTETVRECGKAVADVIEQRARLDAEIVSWYGAGGGLRDFGHHDYPTQAGQALTCAPLTSLA
ncbi:thiaminase II/PqqC family protein [Streptosporangium sp. NPDC004631]